MRKKRTGKTGATAKSGKAGSEVPALLSSYLKVIGSRGGKRGGPARWKGISAEERSRQMKAIRARAKRRT